jgi:predicted acyltransferase
MVFMQTESSAPATGPARFLSIDVLRGLTIALMILVNDPGDWSHTYTQLDHAPWNGYTLTDFVFPNFLFLVGASIIFSLHSRIARGDSKKALVLHVLRRPSLIFGIKMLLTAFPYFHYTHLRIYGVLTRIALCYLAAGLICLVTQRVRTLLVITATLLVGYWLLMRFVPVPGLGTPTHDFPLLDPDRNLAAWLDRAVAALTQRTIHTGTLYERTRDPEGLLSTLPAIATTLIGCVTGLWLRRVSTAPFNSVLTTQEAIPQPDPELVVTAILTSEVATSTAATINAQTPKDASSRPKAAFFAAALTPKDALSRPKRSGVEGPPHFVSTASPISPARCLNGLLLAGVATLAAGLLWNLTFPINKNLWTSSYVLYSAGWSLLTLALCYWLIDMRRVNETPIGRATIWPWLVFGSNAITAFVISNLIVKIMLWIKVPDSLSATGKPITAWFWIYSHIFARHGSNEVTSVAFALAFVAVCFLPNWFLWSKRIVLKI